MTLLEGDREPRSANVRITLSRRSRVPVTAFVETVFEDLERIGHVARRVVIPPGRTTAVVAVPVRANRRDSFQRARFAVTLAVPTQAVAARQVATVTVVDDDPTPTVRVGPATAVEGAGVLRLPVRLSAPSDLFVGVFARLDDGTATFGADHTAGHGDPNVDALLEPGQTRAALQVRLLDDSLVEGDETFTATVEVIDADLDGPRVVTGTIRDDE